MMGSAARVSGSCGAYRQLSDYGEALAQFLISDCGSGIGLQHLEFSPAELDAFDDEAVPAHEPPV
jgi:hypothetical protein